MQLLNAVQSILYRAGLVVVRRVNRPCVIDDEGNGLVVSPVRAFQGLYTGHQVEDLYEPKFEAAFQSAITHNPHTRGERVRARLYFATKFAEMTAGLPGDLLFVGVAFGQAPHCILSYLRSRLGGKRLILMDPYTGARSRDNDEISDQYTTDADAVAASFGRAPVDMVIGYTPDALSGIAGRTLSFVLLNTGDKEAEAASIPILLERLTPGGVLLISGCGKLQSEVLCTLPGVRLSVLNGMCAYIRPLN
jgi:hypothetical protein